MTICGRLSLPFALGFGLLVANVALAAPVSPYPRRNPDEQVRYRLVYDVPDECPRKEEFLARVTDRIGRNWLASSDQEAGTVALTVTQRGDLYTAHMTLVDKEERVAIRALDGSSCVAALSDMAVAVASAIESHLGPQPPYWEFGVGGGAYWRILAPDGGAEPWAWGGNAFGGLRWPTPRRTLRMTLGYWATAPEAASEVEDVQVRFRLYSARAEFCPLELGLGAGFSLPLCAAAEGGALYVKRVYEQGSDENSKASPWFALGLAPRVRLTVAPVFFQLGINADVLLYPGRVVDKPRVEGQSSVTVELHKVSRLGIGAIASVGFGIR